MFTNLIDKCYNKNDLHFVVIDNTNGQDQQLKKFLPDYFYLMNSNYPINPIINKKFFDDTKDFSDYLENDTVIYNQRKND